ncbi:hypothetical protein [Streptomyces sp. NPDC050982]|uniref:hypothetical protein n=1 Tax=Streptomyces sp. NPDC050982 TaxID=3154746 RepID=UPI0033E9C12A
MSASTRYWEFDKVGRPEVLRLAHGSCQEPGRGEVRLNVEALSINRPDLMFLADGYAEKRPAHDATTAGSRERPVPAPLIAALAPSGWWSWCVVGTVGLCI